MTTTTYTIERTDNAHVDPEDENFRVVSRPTTLRGALRVLKPIVAAQRGGGLNTWAFNVRITTPDGRSVSYRDLLDAHDDARWDAGVR